MEVIEVLAMPIEEMFHGLILPFLIIFAITWGILSSLGVFERRINLVLSLALSILVIFTPQFTLFSTYIAQLGGQVAIIAFGVLFGFGVIMWALGRGRDIYEEQLGGSGKVDRLMKKRSKYLKKARDAELRGDKRRARDYMKRVRDIEDDMRLAERR